MSMSMVDDSTNKSDGKRKKGSNDDRTRMENLEGLFFVLNRFLIRPLPNLHIYAKDRDESGDENMRAIPERVWHVVLPGLEVDRLVCSKQFNPHGVIKHFCLKRQQHLLPVICTAAEGCCNEADQVTSQLRCFSLPDARRTQNQISSGQCLLVRC